MALTEYGVGSAEAAKLWSRKLFYETLKQTMMTQFAGEDSNACIQIKDEPSKTSGDTVTYILRMQLSGSGVSGDNTLIGNEEVLSTYTDSLVIDQLRNAVRSRGRMTQQRVPYSIREEAMLALKDWTSARMDTAIFNQLCGNTGETDTRYTGSNAAVAFDASHVVYPDSDTSEADVASSGASSVFSLQLIDYCIEKAKTATVPIRPITVGNKQKYLMFIHPYQEADLRASTDWKTIQTSLLQGGKILDNPIYTNALGEYHDTILHVSSRIPASPTQSTVRRAVFCGAQSCVMSFGQGYGVSKMDWVEDYQDFKNQLGVATGLIWGVKKARFNNEDFATVVVPTYAIAHS